MATGLEAALVKPVVDALIALFKKAKTSKLKSDANKALSDAIRELLIASPNLKLAEARIAVVKAAGIINEDLILAEEMVAKHYASAKTPMKAAARARSVHAVKATTKAKHATKKAAKARPATKAKARTKA